MAWEIYSKMKTILVSGITLAVLLCIISCTKKVDEVSVESQSIGMETMINARELGGYTSSDGRKVRRGLILRTARPSSASENDIRRLTDVYHLATIVDFRMTSERIEAPSPEIPGVKNVWLRIIDEKLLEELHKMVEEVKGPQTMPKTPLEKIQLAFSSGFVSDRMYIDFVSSDQGKSGYQAFFKELLSLPEGKSLLFHCTQGKDRTGIAAMLILSALDVSEDTILRDYELTNAFNKALIEKEKQMLAGFGVTDEAEMNKYLSVMDQVNGKYMVNVLDYLKDEYGSVKGYIKNALKITDEEINQLKDKFLE